MMDPHHMEIVQHINQRSDMRLTREAFSALVAELAESRQKSTTAIQLRARVRAARVIKALRTHISESAKIKAALSSFGLVMERNVTKYCFDEIRSFGTLITFGNDDQLCQKILKLLYFKKWLEFSMQDRKILKLMAKAQKYRTRRLKALVLSTLRAEGKLAYSSNYSQKLLRLGFQSVRAFVFRSKVKKFKARKWTGFLHANLKRKAWELLRAGVQVS